MSVNGLTGGGIRHDNDSSFVQKFLTMDTWFTYTLDLDSQINDYTSTQMCLKGHW